MKKITTLIIAGAVLGLTACADTTTEADYSYESRAPYGNERTVGADAPVTADRVFEKRQKK